MLGDCGCPFTHRALGTERKMRGSDVLDPQSSCGCEPHLVRASYRAQHTWGATFLIDTDLGAQAGQIPPYKPRCAAGQWVAGLY